MHYWESAPHSVKLVKFMRLSRQNGQSDRRVRDSSFKTRNIQGPGDNEPPAEDWSGGRAGGVASRSQETFQEESWLEFQLSRGENEKE